MLHQTSSFHRVTFRETWKTSFLLLLRLNFEVFSVICVVESSLVKLKNLEEHYISIFCSMAQPVSFLNT